ncbi:MDR family MFS transporter [uncultured Alsobacter sp.]|uniref:MDR family MFS transporter n=1 Tax=uncultured Alsobacter sp. TaxID=1748258 RepID=UPI0025CDEEE6|nr:MDR family MFS transporter [uncultured Alsobacter sp.]
MTAASPAARPLEHSEIRLILAGVLLAMALAALDQTIVATALPTIGRELGDTDLLPWIVTSYLVTSTAIAPLYGKISDIHGRRPVLMAGILMFVLGSVACALAPTMLVLILARGLQGLGGGGLIAMGQTIMADMVSPRERGRYQVYFASMFATASLLGPVLGGLFAEHLHWSVIFWINLPLGALAFALSSHFLKRLPRHERPHALDVLGAVLLVAATVSMLLVLNWGGIRYPWLSPQVLGLAGGSLALWLVFAYRLGSADEPLVPLALFANPVIRWASLAALFGMGTFIGLTVYVPAYLEVVKGMSAGDSGLALIPLMVGSVAGASTAGRVMLLVKHYKWVSVIGLGLAATSALTLSFLPAGTPLWQLEILFALSSAGVGTIFPVTTVSVQNAVSPHQLGTATGTVNFSRSMGGALLVAILGAILLQGGVAANLHGLGSGVRPEPSEAAIAAFSWMFRAAALSALLGCLALLQMEERPLRGRGMPVPAAD